MNLFLNACNDPATKNFIMEDMTNSRKFKNAITSINDNISEETKLVHKNMRRAYALRSKGPRKAGCLQKAVANIRNRYSIRQVQSISGMTYRQVYRIIGKPMVSLSKRTVSKEDCLSICNVVLKTTHSMQIPYRRFSKYFYLRDSMHTTYLAYVKEQKQLGLRTLKESTWYKYLPKNVRSQKYIPFMECLCVKCLNLSLLIDALNALDIVVQRRSILNVVSSICPFLVNKNDLHDLPQESPQTCLKPAVKKTTIKFGNIEVAEFDYNSIKVNRKTIEGITNAPKPDKKHDPNKFLISGHNVPENISVETVVRNSSPHCIMRNCNQCGVHLLYEQIVRDNPALYEQYDNNVIWYKWSAPKEIIDGKEFKRPFNKYRHDGSLGTLMNNFYISVHQISKHLFHFKWQAMQYEVLKSSLQQGEVMAVIDFGQNINHKKQREAQGGHYNRRQSAIFPFVCNYLCNFCSALVTHEIVCISDDLKHDAYAIREFEIQAIKLLRKHGVQVDTFYEWCDNCSSEFKSRMPFFLLSLMGVKIVRSFWGENHGKGPADAVIGRVSQVMRSAIARNKTSISHGMDMVLYLQSQSGGDQIHHNLCQHYKKSYIYIDAIKRHLNMFELKTMKGSRDFHCVENTGIPLTLNVRGNSCMCR